MKLALYCASNLETNLVTTVLTVYGIETLQPLALLEQRKSVTTVLTVYGIETKRRVPIFYSTISTVTTVLTVYGIETIIYLIEYDKVILLLQQYLPFTVLKLIVFTHRCARLSWLQQYLPFTVLKPKQ